MVQCYSVLRYISPAGYWPGTQLLVRVDNRVDNACSNARGRRNQSGQKNTGSNITRTGLDWNLDSVYFNKHNILSAPTSKTHFAGSTRNTLIERSEISWPRPTYAPYISLVRSQILYCSYIGWPPLTQGH